MPPLLTRADLDARKMDWRLLTAGDPDAVYFLRPCLKHEAVFLSYDAGVLRIFCALCRKEVMHIAVASERASPSP